MVTATEPAVGRAFTCSGCNETRVTPTLTGPYPKACDVCLGPDGVAARERIRLAARDRGRRLSRERAELEQRVRDLEALLETRGDLAEECGAPSREAVARAVNRLARATGKDDTRHALLVVSDVARAWAARL